MEIQKIKLQMVKDGEAIYALDKISTPKDIVKLVNAHENYNMSPIEKIIVIGMNQQNQINTYSEIASGAVNYANFSMSEVFKVALLSNSTKFILVHNHPSGDATPSKEDIDITNKIEEVAKLMGIQFLDHIVIGDNDSYTSIISERRK